MSESSEWGRLKFFQTVDLKIVGQSQNHSKFKKEFCKSQQRNWTAKTHCTTLSHSYEEVGTLNNDAIIIESVFGALVQ